MHPNGLEYPHFLLIKTNKANLFFCAQPYLTNVHGFARPACKARAFKWHIFTSFTVQRVHLDQFIVGYFFTYDFFTLFLLSIKVNGVNLNDKSGKYVPIIFYTRTNRFCIISILSFKPLFCNKDYVVHSTIYFHVLIYTLISSTYHSLHILNILGLKKYVI